jgi:hypothetical protein
MGAVRDALHGRASNRNCAWSTPVLRPQRCPGHLSRSKPRTQVFQGGLFQEGLVQEGRGALIVIVQPALEPAGSCFNRATGQQVPTCARPMRVLPAIARNAGLGAHLEKPIRRAWSVIDNGAAPVGAKQRVANPAIEPTPSPTPATTNFSDCLRHSNVNILLI